MTDVEGHNGQVHFDGTTITINRDGSLAKLSHLATKTLAIADVTGVQLVAPHGLFNGYIHFQGPDCTHAELGAADAVDDPDSVVFTRKEAADFEALKAAVDAAIATS